jgi:murein DD-endopeptidase MepM/ murein hydrolase activator NlpD
MRAPTVLRQETVLLNASVGVKRVLGRLHWPHRRRASSTWAFRSHPAAPDPMTGQADATRPPVRRKVSRTWAYRRWRPPFGAHIGRRVHAAAAASQLLPFHRTHRALLAAVATDETRPRRRSIARRLGHDRALAAAVAGILLVASVVSVSAGQSHGSKPADAATGSTSGAGTEPRLVVGGAPEAAGNDSQGNTGDVEFGPPEPPTTEAPVFAAIDFGDEAIEPEVPVAVEGPFIDDGTLVKPIAVDTTVPDGSALVKSYKVKKGDKLDAIASRFKVSTMSVIWANDLKSKTDLHTGEILRIPPVTGLIVQVSTTDTLTGIAARYDVNATDILAINGLDDPNLVVGQVLVIPGAKGRPLPTPKPSVRATTTRPSTGGGNVRGPSVYRGGTFLWPVVGGGNYISQYFHYGHYAIDIAADYGSKVRAAGSGTVIFAGWKNNGGGYQVWIAHGSGLYTTYNHMSAITVGRGQSVSRGQQVGRIGQSGNATGPHLHFEVWRGMVWDGGRRVNPLAYL